MILPLIFLPNTYTYTHIYVYTHIHTCIYLYVHTCMRTHAKPRGKELKE